MEYISDGAKLFSRVQRVASFACRICCGLISCGASSGAAESAALGACAAYGFADASAVALPSHAMVCIEADGLTVTKLMRTYAAGNDLSLLEKYVKVLRCAQGGLSLDRAEQMLRSLGAERAGICKTTFGGALACGAFCAFFGGGAADSFTAFISGAIICLLSSALARRGSGGIARTLLLSFTGGAVCLLLCAVFNLFAIPVSPAMCMLGSIMTLVPGLQLSGALRDVLSGDIFSGGYRILYGLAATAAIVAGYAAAGAVFAPITPQASPSGGGGAVIKFISCALGAAGFCIMLNASPSRIFPGVIAALLSFSVYTLCFSPLGQFCANLCGAAAAYICAYALAASHTAPAGVFLTPAVVPLLPGAALYLAADCLTRGDFSSTFLYGTDALVAFFGIAAGIASASVFLRLFRLFAKRKKSGKKTRPAGSDKRAKYRRIKCGRMK